jgi:hypothetical protein
MGMIINKVKRFHFHIYLICYFAGMRQEIDLGAAALSVTQSRTQVIDFTTPFYEEPTAILIPSPREDSKIFACFKPFQIEVNVHRFY